MYDPTKPYTSRVLEIIRTTWDTPFLRVVDYRDHALFFLSSNLSQTCAHVDHTDGIGTKGYYHWEARTWEYAALDALAMNLNDLLMYRAQPFKIQNHITLPWDDDEAVVGIVEALAKHCKPRHMAITGGETSINDMTDAMDVSISMSGLVGIYAVNQYLEGDDLIGVPSTGLHANGFTKVRELNAKDPFLANGEWPDDFLMPTAIYWDACFPIIEIAHGALHVTGGAYTKFKHSLGNVVDICIGRQHQLQPQQIFRDIYNKGVPDEEMYRTFNCGIGFIMAVHPDNTPTVLRQLPTAAIIGGVKAGDGRVRILSAFSNREVVL